MACTPIKFTVAPSHKPAPICQPCKRVGACAQAVESALLGALALVVCYARVHLGYHDAVQVCTVLESSLSIRNCEPCEPFIFVVHDSDRPIRAAQLEKYFAEDKDGVSQ